MSPDPHNPIAQNVAEWAEFDEPEETDLDVLTEAAFALTEKLNPVDRESVSRAMMVDPATIFLVIKVIAEIVQACRATSARELRDAAEFSLRPILGFTFRLSIRNAAADAIRATKGSRAQIGRLEFNGLRDALANAAVQLAIESSLQDIDRVRSAAITYRG